MRTKKELACFLSKLEKFKKPKLKLEQYETEADMAAEIIWDAALCNEIEGKVIADLGAGTGILAIGVLMLGAKKVYLIEKDIDALETAKQNLEAVSDDYEIGKYEFVHADVADFDTPVDIVIQNPPFGTKDKHADKAFLEKAFTLAPVVYSFHKESTAAFVEAISSDNGYDITRKWVFNFPLKRAHKFHTRDIHRVKVGCWRMERK